jgi:hypothetical protein
LQAGKGEIASGVSFVKADNRIIFVQCILPNTTKKGRCLWEDAKYFIVAEQCIQQKLFFHSLSNEIYLLSISPEKCQLFVPVTQAMMILNVQHHCNTGCKAAMSLDRWAVEMEAVHGSVWAQGDSGEYFF